MRIGGLWYSRGLVRGVGGGEGKEGEHDGTEVSFGVLCVFRYGIIEILDKARVGVVCRGGVWDLV